MEEKKRNLQASENGVQELNKDQLESVSRGKDLKEWTCIMTGKHRIKPIDSTAFEMISPDGKRTIYYIGKCNECGKTYPTKYDCTAGKYTSISKKEYMRFLQEFDAQFG